MKKMDHREYPLRLRKKTEAELRFIMQDATEAAKVNHDSPNVGYYLDEVIYAAAELRRRKVAC